jgi:hypothetical protein
MNLSEAETVGLIYDEEDGLGYFTDFGELQQVFEHPELITQPRYAETVWAYLTEDSVSPVPIRRCAEMWPDGADQVFAQILGQPDFSWRRHGEAVLRSSKPKHFARPPRPRFSVIGTRLAAHLESAKASEPNV